MNEMSIKIELKKLDALVQLIELKVAEGRQTGGM